MIYYYNSFENGKRRVIKYDKNISGPAQVYNNHTVFLVSSFCYYIYNL